MDLITVALGVLAGGIITILVSRYYYKRSIQPQYYLNSVLRDVEPHTVEIARRLLKAESRGADHELWLPEGEFDSSDLYSPLFKVTGYATPDDAPEAAQLRLTPLGQLVALFFEKEAQLQKGREA